MLANLTGDVRLMVGDPADLDERQLAEQTRGGPAQTRREHLLSRGRDGGLGPIAVVNSLAPHLLSAPSHGVSTAAGRV